MKIKLLFPINFYFNLHRTNERFQTPSNKFDFKLIIEKQIFYIRFDDSIRANNFLLFQLFFNNIY